MPDTHTVAFLLAGGRTRASSRFRAYQYFPYLEANGIRCRPCVVQGRGRASFLKTLAAAKGADALFIQRKLFKRWKTSLLHCFNKKLLFDFDDALFELNAEKKEKLGAEKAARTIATRRARLDKLLGASRVVVAGNRFLADYAGTRSSRVEVLPTPVEVPPEMPPRPGDGKTVTIGWIGGASSIHYFGAVRDALAKVADTFKRVQIKIVSNAFPRPGIPKVIEKHWALEEETADLDSFDIGIMPLDDDYARGKCAFKILQYFSRGVPAVASPVGANAEVVVDGENGFLAATTDEWVTSLSKLIENGDLRANMGAAGYRKAKEGYSLEVLQPRLLTIIRGVLSS